MDDELAKWTTKTLRRLFKWTPEYRLPLPGEGVFTIGSSEWRTMRYRGHGLDIYRRELDHEDLVRLGPEPECMQPDPHWSLFYYRFRISHPDFLIETCVEAEWEWRHPPNIVQPRRTRLLALHPRTFVCAGDFRVTRGILCHLVLLLEPS